MALVRSGDRTVLTMANDFQGELKEFALVIPVPTFIERDQIQVVDKALLDHLDAYSAPRLVEYFDEDPCRPRVMEMMRGSGAPMPAGAPRKKHGVTVEAQYTVGEYDILILSAKESDGLEAWLEENGYRIPAGASAVLGSYIKQQMRFFVARVNIKEQAKLGFTYLRPLQVSYESPRYMLPIRLGTVNADGPQELFVFALSSKGRVETTNYRTVKLPTGMDLPLYVKGEFPGFYKAMFSEQVRREDMRAVFLEYAWDSAWCDPCAADPPSPEELRKLGVSWLGAGGSRAKRGTAVRRVRDPPPRPVRPRSLSGGPRLPGDRRSGDLSGALRAAPSLHRRRGMRGRRPVPGRALATHRGGGPESRDPDRLERERDPPEDGGRRAAADRGGGEAVPLGEAPRKMTIFALDRGGGG